MQSTKAFTSEIREATRQLAGLGGQKLLQLTLEAVQTVDEAELRAAAPGLAPFRPQFLLTLLTWCYASGIYGSQDILWAIQREGSTARYLCAGTRPGWRRLRRFRRDHRAWLQQCLGSVLTQAWRLQAAQRPAHARRSPAQQSELAFQVAEEAQARLDLAAIIDGAESD